MTCQDTHDTTDDRHPLYPPYRGTASDSPSPPDCQDSTSPEVEINKIREHQLILKINKGLIGYAKKSNHNNWQDLYSEAIIAAIRAFRAYAEKSDEDIIRLSSRAAYNRIIDMCRAEQRYRKLHQVDTEKTENHGESDIEQDITWDIEDTFIELLTRLTYRQRQIAVERYRPSHKSKNEDGLINDASIRRGLEMSKATFSREIERIRETGRELLNQSLQ